MSRDAIDLPRVSHAAGKMWLPGSKSISNRTLLLAALAEGTTRLEALLDSDDTQIMRLALQKLGVRIESVDGMEKLDVHGIGPERGFPVKQAQIYLGNSGTTARMLTAVLAMADGSYKLSGMPRMHERPIGDLVQPLVAAGAQIEWEGLPGFPPIAIYPRVQRPIPDLRIRGTVSSQFLTGLLMALPLAGERARVELEGELISRPYVEMTLDVMAHFGVPVTREGFKVFEVRAGSAYQSPGRMKIEGDASSASYFLAAGALGGGPVRVEGVGRRSVQGDVRFVEVLEAMGADVRFGDHWIEASGKPPLKPFDFDFNRIPDAAMTAAVLALFASGPSRLRNIGSWRVKETDRIAAMAKELRKFGAVVEEGPDFLAIDPPQGFASAPAASEPVPVDTYDDHRMAMCFSLASFGPAPVRIKNPDCVSKTFPAYFEAFERLVS